MSACRCGHDLWHHQGILAPACAECWVTCVGGVCLKYAVELYVTFGCRYAREPHPRYLLANPDGWVKITAGSYAVAYELISSKLGTEYAFTYPADRFGPEERAYYPHGEIEHWKAN